MKNINQSVASLESVFATVMTEHERSKIVTSSVSEHENARNASHISDDSLIFSKDNNPKSVQHMKSIIISPMKHSYLKDNRQESDLPSCCTFDLRDADT
jgi:hypothetical protein